MFPMNRGAGGLVASSFEHAEGWIALTNGVVGEGRALYRAVVDADLEGIVAWKLTDPYNPKHTRWHKILDRDYPVRPGRAEWFRERGRFTKRREQAL